VTSLLFFPKVPEMSEDIVLPIPNLKPPEYVFKLASTAIGHLHEESRKELMEGIVKDGKYVSS
jgi:26S proteasome regulatory subunit N7